MRNLKNTTTHTLKHSHTRLHHPMPSKYIPEKLSNPTYLIPRLDTHDVHNVVHPHPPRPSHIPSHHRFPEPNRSSLDQRGQSTPSWVLPGHVRVNRARVAKSKHASFSPAVYQPHHSAVQCSAASSQCSAVQCSAVQCSAVQCSAVSFKHRFSISASSMYQSPRE